MGIQMLLQSSLSSHYRRKTLKLCTRGVLYFGSPHRGATGTRRNMLRLYLLSAIQPTNGRVLRHLISDSEYLQEQLHDFANIAGSFQTVFFYETEATQIAPMISMRVSDIPLMFLYTLTFFRLYPINLLSFPASPTRR